MGDVEQKGASRQGGAAGRMARSSEAMEMTQGCSACPASCERLGECWLPAQHPEMQVQRLKTGNQASIVALFLVGEWLEIRIEFLCH